MPAITFDKPAILNLKSSRIFTDANYFYMALRFDKDPNNSTQIIDTDQFQADWGITNAQLFRYLQTLESRGVIRIQPTTATINWSQAETTTMTQAEVIAMKKDGLINNTTYVYYALLLNKGAGNSQTVNPTTYQAAPWSIEPSVLMNEMSTISGRQNPDKTPIITLDLTTVQIVWLM